MKEKVSKKFNELYGEGAILFASPGRINLIGEHTDYNGGFVFPGAVDKGIVAAIRLNGTDKVRAYALDLGESSEFGLNEADKPAESWACYIFGVCREIQKRGGRCTESLPVRASRANPAEPTYSPSGRTGSRRIPANGSPDGSGCPSCRTPRRTGP